MSVAAIPIEPGGRDLPDYLPARMVNEFVYCPRLFYYEWVEGAARTSRQPLGRSRPLPIGASLWRLRRNVFTRAP